MGKNPTKATSNHITQLIQELVKHGYKLEAVT